MLLAFSLLLSAPLIAPAPSVLAREAAQSLYEQCLSTGDAAEGITSGLLDCSGQEIDRQDARLNRLYRNLLQRLPAKRRAALRASERQWIKHRDQSCAREAEPEQGGTLGTVIYSSCIATETAARADWLERYK